MRGAMAALLAAAAIWQAWADWRATIGEGYAYRLTSIGRALEEAYPERHAALVGAGEALGAPWLWDPVATTLLGLPLALVLALAAALLWFARRRRRGLF